MDIINKQANVDGTWPLQCILGSLFLILGTYLVLMVKVGPRIMKNKPAYQLNGALAIYNALQVLYACYIVSTFIFYMVEHGIFTTKCTMTAEAQQQLIEKIWLYFVAKHLDIFDTVFFVLRKKDNQVTFLHLYHHCIMVTWAWLHLKYEPTDQFVFIGFLNSFVHVIMYTYYGMAALGPQYSKYLWWKKYLTRVQMMQFVLVILQFHYQTKLSPCPIKEGFYWFVVINISVFLFLFLDFYRKSYKKKSKKSYDDSKNLTDIEKDVVS